MTERSELIFRSLEESGRKKQLPRRRICCPFREKKRSVCEFDMEIRKDMMSNEMQGINRIKLPEDEKIIELYWRRDETAIRFSGDKYGSYCRTIAWQILENQEDSEECVSDTWLKSWQTMPPARPNVLKLFFAKITRNLSLDRYRAGHAGKRGGGETALALEELSECLAGKDDPHASVEMEELVRTINAILGKVRERERNIFLRRYFYMTPVGEIADRYGITVANCQMILSRTRKKLREELIREGYDL